MENQIPMMSASIGKITEALSKFQANIVQPKFNKVAKGTYTFKYADFSACVCAAAPELNKNDLAVVQTIQGNTLVTTLSHKSGEFINSILPLNQQTMLSGNFQNIGSMITYLKRYSYCAILGIVADEDDDANAACDTKNRVSNIVSQQQSQAPKSQSGAYTGAQLKAVIKSFDEKTNIDDLMSSWRNLIREHPELNGNGQINSALFQRASMFALGELEKCDTTDEVNMLVDRWKTIWPAVVADKTPFGNAVAAKYNNLKA